MSEVNVNDIEMKNKMEMYDNIENNCMAYVLGLFDKTGNNDISVSKDNFDNMYEKKREDLAEKFPSFPFDTLTKLAFAVSLGGFIEKKEIDPHSIINAVINKGKCAGKRIAIESKNDDIGLDVVRIRLI